LAYAVSACKNGREPALDPNAAAVLARVESRVRAHVPCTADDVRFVRQLWEQSPADARLRATLQAAYLQTPDWDALVRIELERPRAERSAADEMNLAKLYIKVGRYEDAARILESLARSDSSAQVARLAGHALFYSGHYDRAATYLDLAAPHLRGAEAAEA